MVSGGGLALLYLLAIFSEFFPPYGSLTRHKDYIFAQPQRIRFFDGERLHLRPFVYGWIADRDPVTLRRIYTD